MIDIKDIQLLYSVLLKRQPSPAEETHWLSASKEKGLSFKDVFQRFVNSEEYTNHQKIIPAHPLGHFYSPIFDYSSGRIPYSVPRDICVDDLKGLPITLEALESEFNSLLPFIGSRTLSDNKGEGQLYYINNNIFPSGDAYILDAMISRFRPKRIIEIGSGLSTGCMIDTVSALAIECDITAIEPFPERLQDTLDAANNTFPLNIVKDFVQNVDLKFFSQLEKDDILFIDSSHVLKAGSDVCYELFEIIPTLKPGVLVHFHDIHYPFEYADPWLFERHYSWNEIYGVRAFLSFNTDFRVIAFNAYNWPGKRQLLEKKVGQSIPNTGGGLWMRRV